MDAFSYFFGWPDGGVWANLIASALTAGVAAAFTVWRVRKHIGSSKALYNHLDDLLAGLLPGGVRPHLHHGEDDENGG